jgi:hypothetical protein
MSLSRFGDGDAFVHALILGFRPLCVVEMLLEEAVNVSVGAGFERI